MPSPAHSDVPHGGSSSVRVPSTHGTSLSFRIPICFLRGSVARFALTIAAIACGVALVAAVDLVNQSVLRAFVEVVDTMAGRAALQVSAGEAGLFSEEVAGTVGAIPGVELAVPVVSGSAFASDDSGEMLSVHGVDVANDAAVRVYQAHDEAGLGLDDPLVFLSQPDSIMLTRAFALRRDLTLGDGIDLDTPTGRRRFTVRGLLDPEGVARVYGGNLAVMDLHAAETVFTRPGLVNRVDVVVRREDDVTRVADAIGAALPPGLHVERPQQRRADLHRVMRSLQLVLRAVGLLGLGAAFLIAFNRLATVFEERAWQLGVMRAVGVRARVMWWELIKESLVLGAAGVALGLPLGVGLARLLLPVIATTTALSTKRIAPEAGLVLGRSALVVAIVLGLATAALGAAGPAWRAARADPAATLVGRGIEHAFLDDRRMWLVRALVVAATAGAIVLHTMSGSIPAGLVATAGILVTAALAARPLLSLASVAIARAGRGLGPATSFAVTALTHRPRRAALTIATLGVGFGTVVWICIVAQSFERSVIEVTPGVLRADLVVGSPHIGSGFVEAPMDEDIVQKLAAVPGVRAVVGEQTMDWHYAGGPIVVSAFDPAYVAAGAFGGFTLIGAHLPDVFEGFARGDTAIVSANFVLHLGARVGETITLDTPSGPLDLRVGGVTAALLSPRGTVILSRDVYKRLWHEPHIVHALVRTTGDDADREAVRRAIVATLGARYRLRVLPLAELIDWFAGQVRRAFAAVYALAGMVLLVILFGAADHLAAGVLERRRELGTLRAAGVRARQLRTIVVLEALVLGGLGLVLAIALGFALGALWVHATFPYAIGWVLDLHVPVVHLAVIGTLAVVVCFLAALLPGARAARLEPAVALRYE